MNGDSYATYQYKLRSSGAIPMSPGNFFVQTFGVDRNEVTTWPNTTTIARTDDFTGANVDGVYIQANFQRLPLITENGDPIYKGTTVGRTEFFDESEMPGQRGWWF